MCGRYTLTIDQEALQVALGVEVLLEDHPRPRYNIAPTQFAPVLVDEGGPVCRPLRWGLVPAWADDPAIGSRMINARSESVGSKPSFRVPFRTRRCLVPADGFYEWSTGAWGGEGAMGKGLPGGKTPWFIHASGRAPFTFAGLWDRWIPPGGDAALDTFTILTADAVGPLSGLHHRMPVLVPSELRERWLTDPQPAGALASVLEGARSAAFAFRAHPVSTRVNRPANDGPDLVEGAGGDEDGAAQPSLFD